MKYVVFVIIVFLLASCNTKYNIIDTGLVNGKFDGNMYEYLKSNRYDWDSTRLMIEKADLVDLFEGKREGYEQITFFGPTNHSIRRYLLENGMTGIADMDEELCYEMIMKCVVKGKHMRDDIPRGKKIALNEDDDMGEDWNDDMDGDFDDEENGEEENPGDDGSKYQGTGGIVFTGGMGNRFWIYSFQESYNEVAGVGAVVLYIVNLDSGKKIDIASTNIEPTNGVVHSLHYNFTLGEM